MKTNSSQDNQLIFSITGLYKEDEGKTEEFHLSVEQSFDKNDFTLTSPIETDVTFMKTDKGIAAVLENFTFQVKTHCSRCLKNMKLKIVVPIIERNFLFIKPKVVEDETDLYLCDLKQMEIDLSELFRQEILLHCEPFPVCSTSCKGIIPVQEHTGPELVQPFKDLKHKLKNDTF